MSTPDSVHPSVLLPVVPRLTVVPRPSSHRAACAPRSRAAAAGRRGGRADRDPDRRVLRRPGARGQPQLRLCSSTRPRRRAMLGSLSFLSIVLIAGGDRARTSRSARASPDSRAARRARSPRSCWARRICTSSCGSRASSPRRSRVGRSGRARCSCRTCSGGAEHASTPRHMVWRGPEHRLESTPHPVTGACGCGAVVAHHLAKVRVASSNLVIRSSESFTVSLGPHTWWRGREARHRPAKPFTRVRIPSPPHSSARHNSTAGDWRSGSALP